MTSFWDKESIDVLDNYVPFYKIGSGDLTNYQILKKLALKNKTTLKHEALKSKLINEKDYNKIVDPKKMIYPA